MALRNTIYSLAFFASFFQNPLRDCVAEKIMNEQLVPWVEGQTIGGALKDVARRYPDQDAVIFPHLGYRKTYQEFEQEVERVARALLALEVAKGEHIGI